MAGRKGSVAWDELHHMTEPQVQVFSLPKTVVRIVVKPPADGSYHH
jgi:hypothetical protein